jgi:glycosyltransferase involved in cell wall biosynthesis
MHVGLVCKVDVDYGLDLANTLIEAGTSVTLYMCHAHTGRAVNAPDRPVERLYELGLVPSTCRVRTFRYPRMRDPRSFQVIRKISQTIYADKVDVVHLLVGPGELWLAALACLLRDVPVTGTIITPQPHAGEDLPSFIPKAGYRLLARASDMVIVNGEKQPELVQKVYGIPANRVTYVPLGVRITALKWAKEQKAEEPGQVLFIGSARLHKGLEYLIRAQPLINRQVPHARIVIASYGKELDRCKKVIEDPSKFEIHEGFMPGDMMSAFFQKASLVALPYLTAASSGILMTALVFSKPVVTTRIDGLMEYIEDGVTGLLVPPTNVEQLATAIIRLLSDSALRQQMRKNIANWVNTVQQRVVTQTLATYEKAITLH